MRRSLQLAAVLLFTAATTHAQFHLGGAKQKDSPAKYHKSDVEWLWQYSASDDVPDGNENDLVRDDQFRPMIAQYFTAPQTFWGTPVNGKYRPLNEVVLDFLTVPGKVLSDDNRYLSITGCVVHFCPARGMLWADLNSRDTLMIFSAIDWIKDGKPTSQPGAEYTLWIFPNQPLNTDSNAGNRIPPAFTSSLARWSVEPIPGSGIIQNITHAILVEPDGTPHELPIASLGIKPPKS